MSIEFDDDIGFDPIDTRLRAQLGAAAPEPGDPDAVLAGLRPRLVRARRRRQTGIVAIGAAAIVCIAGLAFAVTDTAPKGSVNVPPASHSTPAPGPNGGVTTESPTTATTTQEAKDAGRQEPAAEDTQPAGGSSSSGSSGSSGSGSTTSGTGASNSGSESSSDEPPEDNGASESSGKGNNSGSGDGSESSGKGRSGGSDS